MFNKFVKFRDALIDLYMNDHQFYVKLKAYIDIRPHNIQKIVYDYFLIYERELCQAPIFNILKLNSLNDFGKKISIQIKKTEYRDRIEFRITPTLLHRLEAQCKGNKSIYIRKIMKDYADSIDIFPIFEDLRFLKILPDRMLKIYNSYSKDKFFSIGK